MKVGDLITLSAYALQSESMWKVRDLVWKHKKPLIGLVVRVEENPYNHSFTSKNEKTFYYINWMQKDGPSSRWSNSAIGRMKGYFLRNDLKFVK